MVESATRPILDADLVDGLSRYLKVPVLGRFAIVDPSVAPGPGRDELRAAGGRGRPALLARGRRSRLKDRAVLLVDDLVVTGWTLTLAARAIRAAGAAEVLPLVLGVSG